MYVFFLLFLVRFMCARVCSRIFMDEFHVGHQKSVFFFCLLFVQPKTKNSVRRMINLVRVCAYIIRDCA